MRVLKFGGTSMGDEGTWRQVLDLISRYENPVVVVSATARTTRQLIAAAELALTDYDRALSISKEIQERHRMLVSNFLDHYRNRDEDVTTLKEECDEWIGTCIQQLQDELAHISDVQKISPRKRDAVAALGEKLSSRLLVHCARIYGFEAEWIDAAEIIHTDSDYGNATPDRDRIVSNVQKIRERLNRGTLPVLGGYYGSDSEGYTTTLGFEGSDYTASLIGAALHAGAIEIWTDVSGIYTCDPRVVEQARPIPELSFEEATELAYFGAKVLHPSTMKPAAEAGIPILVKNIFEPDQPGSVISESVKMPARARAISYLDNVDIITITAGDGLSGHEFLSRVFQILSKFHVPVDAVTTTEASVSIALEHPGRLEAIREELDMLGEIHITTGQALISLISCQIERSSEIAEQVLKAVANLPVSMLSFSRDKRNLNIATDTENVKDAVKAIHQSIFGDPDNDQAR